MQEGIIKENKELKQEVKVLKFKLNRLSNKFSSNQQQWVKTLKEMQKPSDDSELRPDCGESSETDVSMLVIYVALWEGKHEIYLHYFHYRFKTMTTVLVSQKN